MTGYLITFSNGELYHHGILGQHWGKKNGPPYPLGAGDHSAEEVRKNPKIAKLKEDIKSEKKNKSFKTVEQYNKHDNRIRYLKNQLSDEKIKDRLSKRENNTEHFDKLVEKYKKAGQSDEEARISAYKRQRMERILIAAGAVALTAAAIYVAKEHYDKYADRLIKPGVKLQSIGLDEYSKDLDDVFYAAYKTTDKIKYKGNYGLELQLRNFTLGNGKAKLSKNYMYVDEPLKIASRNNARKALKEIYDNDREAASYIRDLVEGFPALNTKQMANKKRALKSLNKDKIDKNVYDVFNRGLAGRHNFKQNDSLRNIYDVQNRFYDLLKEKGYDAISDRNDKSYSGYKSKDPLIIFNGRKSINPNITKKKLSGLEVALNEVPAMAMLKSSTILPGIAAYSYINKQKNSKVHSLYNSKVIKKYKKDHPGTKLSDKEILANYYNT